MPSNTGDEDRGKLTQFREAWREAETNRDPAALIDLLAEDFVWLPAWDAEPELGKDEMIDHLEGVSGDYHTLESQRLIVRDDWAVEQLRVHGTLTDEESGETDEITFGGNEVYLRQDDGEWEQILSLPYLPYRSIDFD